MKKVFLFFAVINCLFVIGCKKNVGTTNQNDPSDTSSSSDILSNFDVDLLTSGEQAQVNLDTIGYSDKRKLIDILNDADPDFLKNIESEASTQTKTSKTSTFSTNPTSISSVEKQKALLLSEFLAKANSLCDRSNYRQITGQPNGLSYVPGSKSISNRSSPPKKPGFGCLSSSQFGLDCSGFIYQLGKKAGLDMDSFFGDLNVDNLKDANVWSRALSSSANFNQLSYVAITRKIPVAELAYGDIIVWPTPGHQHIGIYLAGKLYSSSGYFGKRCAENTDSKHGPSIYPITDKLLTQFGDGSYEILRIKPGAVITYIVDLRTAIDAPENRPVRRTFSLDFNEKTIYTLNEDGSKTHAGILSDDGTLVTSWDHVTGPGGPRAFEPADFDLTKSFEIQASIYDGGLKLYQFAEKVE